MQNSSVFMTPRQRMLSAFEFTSPDKIPVVYHPSPAGLYVHGEQLLRLLRDFPPDNPIAFDIIPAPPAESVDANGNYHEIRKDEWGTGWEFKIFGIQGHPKTYPFVSWEAAGDYNFPPLPTLNTNEVKEQKKTFLLFAGGISIFEKLHALQPFDQVLMDITLQNPAFLYFLDRLVDYWLQYIDILIKADIDVIMFGDDWGTQHTSLISPKHFKTIFKPKYKLLMDPILHAGKKVFFHSCGYLGGVLDDLIDLGIHGLWPQINLMEQNASLMDKCIQYNITLYIHLDRQYLVPLGTPDEIRIAIKKYADMFHALNGGGIFYVEIENDAPFDNVKTLIQSIHQFR